MEEDTEEGQSPNLRGDHCVAGARVFPVPCHLLLVLLVHCLKYTLVLVDFPHRKRLAHLSPVCPFL